MSQLRYNTIVSRNSCTDVFFFFTGSGRPLVGLCNGTKRQTQARHKPSQTNTQNGLEGGTSPPNSPGCRTPPTRRQKHQNEATKQQNRRQSNRETDYFEGFGNSNGVPRGKEIVRIGRVTRPTSWWTYFTNRSNSKEVESY